MATPITLSLNKSQDTGPDPVAQVTLDPTLKPGTYTFTLTVTDDAGLQSAPAQVVVQVRDLPIARVTGPQKPVPLGQPFVLSGDGSASSLGKIVNYTWTLVANA
jgi:hypothetical protein